MADSLATSANNVNILLDNDDLEQRCPTVKKNLPQMWRQSGHCRHTCQKLFKLTFPCAEVRPKLILNINNTLFKSGITNNFSLKAA